MSNSIVANFLTTQRRALSSCMLGICLLSLLGNTGCRSTTDNQIDLLERELRVQEDYIYELEGYVVDYSEKLRDCRGCSPSQTAVYSEEVYEPAPASSSSKSTKKSTPRRSKQEKSIIDSPQEDLPSPPAEQTPGISPEDMEVPEIEFQMEDPLTDANVQEELQQVAAVELDYRSAEGEALMIPDPVGFESDEPSSSETEEADESDLFDEEVLVEQQPETVQRVAKRLEVKHLFRSGEEDAAEKNLLTVVEALDENDEPVDLDGEVSLMVMTPEASGQMKRVKRWNFTAAETRSAWQSSDLGDGLHLELPLEAVRLPKAPLELWARLVTADGRKLLTKLPFETQTLVALGEGEAQPKSAESALASTDESANPLRDTGTRSIEPDENLKLANKEISSSKTRWRSSSRHVDTPSKGFATTAGQSNGWTKQTPGRLSYRPTKAGNR